MTASLNEKLRTVKWGEYKLGDLFDIDSTSSFNTDVLVDGEEYDYVTRTSFNQGVLRSTGFVNSENINPAGTWSLGLLQMDFFYRKKPWYAGQFSNTVKAERWLCIICHSPISVRMVLICSKAFTASSKCCFSSVYSRSSCSFS